MYVKLTSRRRNEQDYIEQRALAIAKYMITTGATIREAASKFHVSTHTVMLDINKRLPEINLSLWRQVMLVISIHKYQIRRGHSFRTKAKTP